MDDETTMLCPVCSEKGETSFVKLFQINANYASYFCENETCIYPGTCKGVLSVLKRTPEQMPVPLRLLQCLELPETLIKEPTLTLSDLNQLTQIKSLLPYLESIFNCEDDWAKLVKKMEENGYEPKHFKALQVLRDPHFKMLQKLNPKIKQFLRHYDFKPDTLERLVGK